MCFLLTLILFNQKGDAYRCASSCCDNTDLSHENLQRCVEKCTLPVQKADSYMQSEMQNLHVNQQFSFKRKLNKSFFFFFI